MVRDAQTNETVSVARESLMAALSTVVPASSPRDLRPAPAVELEAANDEVAEFLKLSSEFSYACINQSMFWLQCSLYMYPY